MVDRHMYEIFQTAWGWMGLVQGQKGCRGIILPLADSEAVEKMIKHEYPGAVEKTSSKGTLTALFDDYFRGSTTGVALALDWNGYSPFQVMIWRAAQAVPRGEVRTYRELSRAVGRPAAHRAVGNALGRNPFPLAVPCHRVVRSDGGLGGFSAPAGVALKRRLLELEGIAFDRRGRVIREQGPGASTAGDQLK